MRQKVDKKTRDLARIGEEQHQGYAALKINRTASGDFKQLEQNLIRELEVQIQHEISHILGTKNITLH